MFCSFAQRSFKRHSSVPRNLNNTSRELPSISACCHSMFAKLVTAVLLQLQLAATRSVPLSTDPPAGNAALLPPPATPKIVNSHLAQGTTLSGLFFISKDEVDRTYLNKDKQKQFVLADLVGPESSWAMQCQNVPTSDSMKQIAGYLDGARGAKGLAMKNWQFEPVTFDMRGESRWKDTTFSQSRKYTQAGKARKPTWASYRSITSYTDKVFILMDFQSPEDVNTGGDEEEDLAIEDLPPLHRLSDIAYLDYARGFQYPDKESPNSEHSSTPSSWFLLKNVGGNEETADRQQDLSVISWCLSLHNLQLQPWPGTTFPIGSKCFKAILGTYPSYEIAGFLIEHKYRFPEAALASVTVFSEDDGVSLLWFGGKLDLRALKFAGKVNEGYEKVNVGKLEFPYPLIPEKVGQEQAQVTTLPFRGKKRPASEISE
ncbi:hypothetical protein HII31_10581 [Pseudocercospora fuligena]|uniref:Uncharacterized protein n=1 Tax=Pseudocercospora fuligena TaxID=685502 RepID=A0A8H6RCU0_9PEZI|nr:hypothetical protein HII31_10581 [Pseudocercospora fuligena]